MYDLLVSVYNNISDIANYLSFRPSIFSLPDDLYLHLACLDVFEDIVEIPVKERKREL